MAKNQEAHKTGGGIGGKELTENLLGFSLPTFLQILVLTKLRLNVWLDGRLRDRALPVHRVLKKHPSARGDRHESHQHETRNDDGAA